RTVLDRLHPDSCCAVWTGLPVHSGGAAVRGWGLGMMTTSWHSMSTLSRSSTRSRGVALWGSRANAFNLVGLSGRRRAALRSGLGPLPCHPRAGFRPVIAPASSPYDCQPRPVNGHVPLAGAVAAAAFSNDRPATALGIPGGLNANRFPAG